LFLNPYFQQAVRFGRAEPVVKGVMLLPEELAIEVMLLPEELVVE